MPELVLTAHWAITQAAMDRVYPSRWRLLIVLAVFVLVAATDAMRGCTDTYLVQVTLDNIHPS